MTDAKPQAAQTFWCDRILQLADRYRYAIFAAIALAYLAGFNGQWRMEPDAALYLSIGRNLAQGRGFTYLGHPNRLAYPGWPALIALTFKLFGTESLVPVHVLMLLIALTTVAFTYRMVLLHSNRPTAVVVTLGVALTKSFFVYGFELWSDMPFACGVMMFFAGYEGVNRPQRRWYDWAFLLIGLAGAMVTRPTMWLLLIAIAATLLYRTVRGHLKWTTLVGGFALVLIIALACFALDPRRHSSQDLWGDQYERYVLGRFSGQWSQMLRDSLIHNTQQMFAWAASDVLFQVRLGPGNWVVSLCVIILGLLLFRVRALWGFWFLLLLICLLLVLPLDRYFLPVLPLLVYSWWEVIAWLNRNLPRQIGNIAFAILAACGAGMNLSKTGGVIAMQRSQPFLAHYDRGVFDAAPQIAREIHDRVDPNAMVIVGAPYSRVLAFLSQRYVIHAAGTSVAEVSSRPVFVVEPDDEYIQALLQQASLEVLPPLVTVTPEPGSGSSAHSLSLCPTAKVIQTTTRTAASPPSSQMAE